MTMMDFKYTYFRDCSTQHEANVINIKRRTNVRFGDLRCVSNSFSVALGLGSYLTFNIHASRLGFDMSCGMMPIKVAYAVIPRDGVRPRDIAVWHSTREWITHERWAITTSPLKPPDEVGSYRFICGRVSR